MAVYEVDFQIKLGVCKNIEARNEREALEIAQRLSMSDFVDEVLIPEWDSPWSGWDNEPEEPMVFGETSDSPSYTRDELEDYIDFDGIE